MAWQLDPAHTQVEFSAKLMMITTVRGRFSEFSATAELDESRPDEFQPSAESSRFRPRAWTPTRAARRPPESPEFFDVEKYPTITFKSDQVAKAGNNKLEGHRRPDRALRDQAGDVGCGRPVRGDARIPGATPRR